MFGKRHQDPRLPGHGDSEEVAATRNTGGTPMSNCDAVRDGMPLLLTESLDPAQRELTHQHIEQCPACTNEWVGYQNTWKLLEQLPVIEPPARLKERVLGEVVPAPPRHVVPFHRNAAFNGLAHARALLR